MKVPIGELLRASFGEGELMPQTPLRVTSPGRTFYGSILYTEVRT